MKELCRLNGIDGMVKSRLIKKGVIGDQFSTDENYLRLRWNLHPLAMYVHLWNCDDDKYDDSVTLASNKSWRGLSGMLLDAETVKVVSLLNKMSGLGSVRAIPSVVICKTNLGVYSQLSEVLFDTGTKHFGTCEAADKCIDINRRKHISEEEESYLSQFDFEKALLIKHPEAFIGIKRSMKLLESQSSIIREQYLSMIDYDTLDWRKVLAHRNFNLLQWINQHKNNQYLKEFMDSDGREYKLVEVYNKSITSV